MRADDRSCSLPDLHLCQHTPEEQLLRIRFGQITDGMVEQPVVLSDAARRNVLLHQSVEKGALVPGKAYPLSVPDHGPKSLAPAWLQQTRGGNPDVERRPILPSFRVDKIRRGGDHRHMHFTFGNAFKGRRRAHPMSIQHDTDGTTGMGGKDRSELLGQSRAAPETRAPLGFPRALALGHVTNYIFSRFSMHRIALFSRILEGS
jgi:hypothetical protein